MIKIIALLKRRPGMSFDEFVDYYENNHAPLAVAHMAGAQRYVRQYLRPLDGKESFDVEPPIDVVTQLWIEDQKSADAIFARLAEPSVAAAITADEALLFDTSSIRVFRVDERDSVIPAQ